MAPWKNSEVCVDVTWCISNSSSRKSGRRSRCLHILTLDWIHSWILICTAFLECYLHFKYVLLIRTNKQKPKKLPRKILVIHLELHDVNFAGKQKLKSQEIPKIVIRYTKNNCVKWVDHTAIQIRRKECPLLKSFRY